MNFEDDRVRRRLDEMNPKVRDTVRHFSRADWSAVIELEERFGALWWNPNFQVTQQEQERERTRREILIGKYLDRMPEVYEEWTDDEGKEHRRGPYSHPYSLGIHLAALKAEVPPTPKESWEF